MELISLNGFYAHINLSSNNITIKLFSNRIPDSDLPTYLESCDIGVTPYLRTTTPASLLLFMSFGKPVIGSRIGGIPEMINDGVNGYLFTSGNVDDLRDKLELLLSMSEKDIRHMGKAARQKIETQYSADLHYKRLMDIYSKARDKRS